MKARTLEFAINDGEGLTHVFLQDPESSAYWAFAREQDEEEYYVEKDEQSFAVHCGILAATLSQRTLRLRVAQAEAAQLRCREEEVIDLELDSVNYPEMAKAFKFIFGDAFTFEE